MAGRLPPCVKKAFGPGPEGARPVGTSWAEFRAVYLMAVAARRHRATAAALLRRDDFVDPQDHARDLDRRAAGPGA